MQMQTTFDTGLMWFRRDLRTSDNAALHMALSQCAHVHCAFIFDTDILAGLPQADRRVEFIRESLVELDASLRELCGQVGAGLIVRHAVASDEILKLASELRAQAVFAARDYEPQAVVRDASVQRALAGAGRAFFTCKDQVIFEGREILTQSGTPYGVFTPYKNNWLARVAAEDVGRYDSAPMAHQLEARPAEYQHPVPSFQILAH